ncbi:hypothetical protein OCL06_12390 [Alteromonas sp. ASW11-19]|uniref:Flagellar assembly protein T N-terminal domain-containing protein n=1 Tax=Alteromonas salexigens TaxID=2982530 RepID=A0ABT2VT17_9ALTE|nr:hypothetical protein [Alteromonas salexigens]MCU7555386.1 hypothetical protein [Alteromonas salexigens]
MILRALLVACSLVPAVAEAQQHLQISLAGDISTQNCAYGRGDSAIQEAKAQALAEISRQVKSGSLLSLAESQQSLSSETISYLQTLSSLQQEGMDLQGLKTDISAPVLQGSETCITVTLLHQSLSQGQSEGGWATTDEVISVTVVGEGWEDRQRGVSARKSAELDALRRAISQVVGTWLTEQRSQHSNTAELTTETTSNFELQSFVAQQLQTKSAGTVKAWSVLESQPIQPNGMKVTIRADVEKTPLAVASKNILQQIGSPRVAVVAPQPLADTLRLWLSEQGIEISSAANLTLRASHQLIKRSGTARLNLSIILEDQAGNAYGRWQNRPELIALPYSDQVLRDLIKVHLSTDGQKKEFHQQLNSAFMRVVKEEGLIHDIFISSQYLSQPDRLNSVLSTMGGASAVSVSHSDGIYKAQMRFTGTTGELVAALRQSLQPIAGRVMPQPTINNDFNIRFD